MSGSVADAWTGALRGGQSEYNDPPDTHAGIFGRNAQITLKKLVIFLEKCM